MCYTCKLLSIQPDFIAQQCEIEEKIEGLSNRYRVLYYPKFHCELNYIEYFWYHSKWYARESCDYTIDDLRRHVPDALVQVRNSTILGSFESCMKKMELYRQGIAYGAEEWKKLTSHQKVYLPIDRMLDNRVSGLESVYYKNLLESRDNIWLPI